MNFDYDLFVIGGGSGGVRAARIAAQHGAKVGLAEEFRMGGTCVIRGCVPKKLMVYASQFRELAEDATAYGWEMQRGPFDWPRFIAAKDREIARLEGIYRRNLENAGVVAFDMRATLAGPHEVRLSSGETLSAKHILLAVGGTPFVPDVEGRELAITSNEIFHLEGLPERIVIVGGGYIACEFACILRGLGAQVHLVYRRDEILRGFDSDVRSHVQDEMAKKGIMFHLNADVKGLERKGGRIHARLNSGMGIDCDQVLYATGRVPNTRGLGLEEAGVELRANGAVVVDGWSQTRVPSIYAVGDVTDRIQLTPVAIREGHAFADTVFGDTPWQADHGLVPSAVFTQPEVGTVGATEEEARATCDVEIFRTSFTAMYHAFAGREERMMMKLVVNRDTGQVLGVHIVGHGAGEMIQMIGVAVKMGATKADIDACVAVHPTAAEELVTMRFPVAS